VGFSFALVRLGPGDLQARPLRPPRCDRFRRPGKSSGPPPFAPSLNVYGDDAHNNSGFSVIDALNRQTVSQCCANGGGHNCVPNKDRADFPPVLEFSHTSRSCGASRAQVRATSRGLATVFRWDDAGGVGHKVGGIPSISARPADNLQASKSASQAKRGTGLSLRVPAIASALHIFALGPSL
jgi:hypothetical protein